jgi:hypothetical protein
LEKTAAIPKVGQQLTLLTSAITASTSTIDALPHAPATSDPVEIQGLDDSTSSLKYAKRQLIAVGALLGLIIIEIFATVGAAIAILGLGGLLIFINPVTGALVALIVVVQVVLNVVLLGVIALLNSLLAGLALGLSGL